MEVLDFPRMEAPQRLSPSWSALPAWLPVPGMGALAVNAFVLKGAEPMLVDTGLAALRDPFLAALASEIDLDDLRWIWLSHTDADHIGNLAAVLERAPRAKIVTTFLGAGKLGLAGFDTSRLHLVEEGAEMEIGGHRLRTLRPPYYDAPESLGFLDVSERALFAVDSFGALLPGPVEALADVGHEALGAGLATWSAIDAPWLAVADRGYLDRALTSLASLEPAMVLSGHLPPSHASEVKDLIAVTRDALVREPITAPVVFEELLPAA